MKTLPPLARVPLLVLGLASLVTGVFAGLARVGVSVPDFGAMQAGNREMKGLEEIVGIEQCPARHQRERAAELPCEPVDIRRQGFGNDDAVRRRGQVEQRAVDVEKQRPLVRPLKRARQRQFRGVILSQGLGRRLCLLLSHACQGYRLFRLDRR